MLIMHIFCYSIFHEICGCYDNINSQNVAKTWISRYGKSCISSYSKKYLFFAVYELIKFVFLRNGTVRTNKMKF